MGMSGLPDGEASEMGMHRLWAGTVVVLVFVVLGTLLAAWWMLLWALVGLVLIVCSFAEEGTRR